MEKSYDQNLTELFLKIIMDRSEINDERISIKSIINELCSVLRHEAKCQRISHVVINGEKIESERDLKKKFFEVRQAKKWK